MVTPSSAACVQSSCTLTPGSRACGKNTSFGGPWCRRQLSTRRWKVRNAFCASGEQVFEQRFRRQFRRVLQQSFGRRPDRRQQIRPPPAPSLLRCGPWPAARYFAAVSRCIPAFIAAVPSTPDFACSFISVGIVARLPWACVGPEPRQRQTDGASKTTSFIAGNLKLVAWIQIVVSHLRATQIRNSNAKKAEPAGKHARPGAGKAKGEAATERQEKRSP